MAYPPSYKPMRLDKASLPPAGVGSCPLADMFRSCCVIGRKPLKKFMVPENRWNYPGTKYYSRVPHPTIGLPFDNTKPRKGRWGETAGTRGAEDAEWLHQAWDDMKWSRQERDDRALEEARADLQKRIEICLYGAPRSTQPQGSRKLPIQHSHVSLNSKPIH